MSTPKPRYLHIAAQVQSRLAEDPTYELPSITELAEQWDVSYVTMWKAAQELVRKGLVVAPSGRKIRRVRSGSTAGDAVESSVDTFYTELKRRVLDGVYKGGKSFPKTGYMVASENLSPATVGRALLRLGKENLAHKAGGRWIVGPAPALSKQPASGARRPNRDSVVLLACYNSEDVNGDFESPFMSGFINGFKEEAANFSLRFSPVILNRSDPAAGFIPAGLDKIGAHIKALGHSYRGTLIHSVQPLKEGVGPAVSRLCRYEQPVVFLDSTEKGAPLTRSALNAPRTYYRCHFDHRGAITVALRQLLNWGHSSLAIYGSRDFDFEWVGRRIEYTRECAAQLSPKLHVIAQIAEERYWGVSQYMSSDADEFVADSALFSETILSGGSQDEVRKLLLDGTPRFTSMLVEHSPSALVALNDEMARKYYFWFRAMDIRVPQDISIVAFDNIPKAMLFPLSTVDFGFGHLGYLSAHLFLGDMQIRADRQGAIPGRPTYVDRGSVGEPSTDNRMRKLLQQYVRRYRISL